MRNLLRAPLGAMLLVCALSCLDAGNAHAQMLGSPTTQGALVTLPYLTSGGHRVTVATVTNTNPLLSRRLHLTFISGADWSAVDTDCVLTPFETTYVIVEPGVVPGTAQARFECSNVSLASGSILSTDLARTVFPHGEDGVLVITLEDPALNGAVQDATLYENALLADATVIDFVQGFAFSIPGIHFQGVGAGPGDRSYVFDGLTEYTSFPTSLATNFIAPDDDTTAELILFTLDGRVGGGNPGAPGILVELFGFAFDDDENPTSGRLDFDCFAVADIAASPNGFGLNVRRDYGGHNVGHLSLTVDPAVRNDVHEVGPAGDGNGARLTPAHGWLVQTTTRLGDLVGTGNRAAGNATWARQLIQGPTALVPLQGDVTSLDAR